MIEFYQLRRDSQLDSTAVVVAEDTVAGILLRWVPDTGLWHRCIELENDYLFGDTGGVYNLITSEDAVKLMNQVLPFDQTRAVARRILDRYKTQPLEEQRTNNQMGLAIVGQS